MTAWRHRIHDMTAPSFRRKVETNIVRRGPASLTGELPTTDQVQTPSAVAPLASNPSQVGLLDLPKEPPRKPQPENSQAGAPKSQNYMVDFPVVSIKSWDISPQEILPALFNVWP